MLFLFVLGCIVLLVAGIAAVIAQRGSIAVAGVLFFLLAWIGSSVGTVDTKNVGVVTSFKKPTGETKEAGLYFKAPWKSVTDMSLAWQTETYKFDVQTAGGPVMKLEILPRWKMTRDAAPEMFQNYKDFEGVRANLFYNELRDAANKQFENYNPLTNVDVKTGNPIKTKEMFAQELKTELEKRFSAEVEVNGKKKTIKLIELDRVAMPTIKPDDTTQEKINQQVAEFARGKILDQQLVNAQKEKAIAQEQAKISPELFCMREAIRIGQNPGYCLMGGGSVIVDSTTKK